MDSQNPAIKELTENKEAIESFSENQNQESSQSELPKSTVESDDQDKNEESRYFLHFEKLDKQELDENIAKPLKSDSERQAEQKRKMDNLYASFKALMGLQYMKKDGLPIEVLPNLYIGSIGAALNKKGLQETGINAILCCCDGVKQAFPEVKLQNNFKTNRRLLIKPYYFLIKIQRISEGSSMKQELLFMIMLSLPKRF
jgi:hypothetical protein